MSISACLFIYSRIFLLFIIMFCNYWTSLYYNTFIDKHVAWIINSYLSLTLFVKIFFFDWHHAIRFQTGLSFPVTYILQYIQVIIVFSLILVINLVIVNKKKLSNVFRKSLHRIQSYLTYSLGTLTSPQQKL
jgi:hypothetical protein